MGSAPTSATDRSQWANPLAEFEPWLGSIIGALGAILLVMWLTGRDTDRPGMIFLFLGGVFILPLGLALVSAGLALPRWPMVLDRAVGTDHLGGRVLLDPVASSFV